MTYDEMLEEYLAAEESGDVEAAEYWQGLMDEFTYDPSFEDLPGVK